MTCHDLKLFPATICDCSGSDCWAKKECERLQGMSEEIEGFEYEFLSLACDKKSLFKKKISMPFYKSVKSSLRD